MPNTLLFFIKYPTPGKVKTRLGKSIGHDKATSFYKAFVEDVLDSFEQAGFNTIIFYDTSQPIDMYTNWLGDRQYQPQQGNDLGERMRLAFEVAFKLGHTKCILTGSDLPGLDPQIINNAFESLKIAPSCIGPANDGGYYLIGFQKKNFAKSIFENMKWSTDSVFTMTQSRLKIAGHAPIILPSFSDIDTKEDLIRLARNKDRKKLSPRTTKLLTTFEVKKG